MALSSSDCTRQKGETYYVVKEAHYRAIGRSAACIGRLWRLGRQRGPSPTTNSGFAKSGKAGQAKDPTRQAPAAPIPGAQKGGTLTVLSTAGLTTMDPTEVYYINTGSIESGLVIRSLTQYVYDPKTQDMTLVPDLATNLGTPSNHYKTWKFTLRPGIKFENGQAVTAEDLKYGIERSFDRATFPGGANYSNQYFLHGDTYQGPYKSPGNYDGVTVSGNTITIKMSKPFPDMPYWGSFPAMSPIPPGNASNPATYKNHPLATGPYMFKQGGYVPGQSLVLVKNPYWSASTDPGRHQYINEFDFNFATDSAKIDAIMLADTGTGQTTISYDPILSADYQKFNQQSSDRLVVGRTALHVHLVSGQPQDHEHQRAPGVGLRLPVPGSLGGRRLHPGSDPHRGLQRHAARSPRADCHTTRCQGTRLGPRMPPRPSRC